MITTFHLPQKMSAKEIHHVMSQCNGHLINSDKNLAVAYCIALHASNINVNELICEIRKSLETDIDSSSNKDDFFDYVINLLEYLHEEKKVEDRRELAHILHKAAREESKNPESHEKMIQALLDRMPAKWNNFDPYINALYNILYV